MASREEVKKLAELSRLDIPDADVEAFGAEFGSILDYVGELESLTLNMHETPEAGIIRNVFREDAHPHESGKYTERIVEAFPEKEGNSLKVKQILSHD